LPSSTASALSHLLNSRLQVRVLPGAPTSQVRVRETREAAMQLMRGRDQPMEDLSVSDMYNLE
jgi:hypothetical protein